MNRLRSTPLPAVQLREALRSDLDTLPDAELLDRFARYADHPAFEALVRRHGPMVFGVCRRTLASAPDADDAFQATFLVLIRKARSLRRADRLGPWLYGVAYRVALKARARAARLAEFCTEATDMIPDPTAPADVPDWLPVLDAELAALPAKYRDPLVLCELQGASRADAAKALGVPEGTLSSRLARGRDLLRNRLLKHGTLLPAGGLAALFAATGVSRAAVPLALLARTSELAKVATGAAAGAVPVAAARLTDEVLKGMFLTKLRTAGGALALLLVATLGLAAAAWPGASPGAAEEKRGTQPPASVHAPADPRMAPPVAPHMYDLRAVGFVDKGTVPRDPSPGAPADRDALQGLWTLEKFDLSGKGVNENELREVKDSIGKSHMLIAGDVWWLMLGGHHGNVLPYRVKLDPTKNPKWIDMGELIPDKNGTVSAGIYELDGDKLRICAHAGDNNNPRPAEFTSDDTPLMVMTFRRGKMPPSAGEKALVGSWMGEEVVTKLGPEEPDRRYTPRAVILDGFLFLLTDRRMGGEWIGGKYTVDATKNPKWIDVELAVPMDESKVTKLYGCYETADGRIKLALKEKRATRPLEFSGDYGALVFDLKPSKEPRPKPADAPMPRAKVQ